MDNAFKAISQYQEKQESHLQSEINKELCNSSNSSIKKEPIKNYKEELKKLENFYEQMLKNKDLEYEKILLQVDHELSEKENENDELKNKNNELTNKYNILVDLLKDYETEKEDYQKSIIELTNKLEENKKASEKFISQLKKLQSLKPEDKSMLNQLDENNKLNSNEKIITQIIENEYPCNNNLLESASQQRKDLVCVKCSNKITKYQEIENDKQNVRNENFGFINSDNFTNKFIEILKENDFDFEKFKTNTQEKSFNIKILDLENLIVSIFEDNRDLKLRAIEIQNLLLSRDSKLKELLEKDQRVIINIEELRKEKLSLQNKISKLNELSLLKENLSIEKMEKQESYFKLETNKKIEEINELKNIISEYLKKFNEMENINSELRNEIEKKNDQLFDFKNKTLDKNQLQIYYTELHKNADNFITEKQKILDKNISLFRDVEENIYNIKNEMKQLKSVYDIAEDLKKRFNEYNNSIDLKNNDSPVYNAFNENQKNSNYLNEIEKILEDYDDYFGKIEDEIVSNFAFKNVSILKKSSSKGNNIYQTKNNSVFINNKRTSIVCRVENLNTTINSNKKANNSSDSNVLTDENNSNNENNSSNGKSKNNENFKTQDSINLNSRSNIDFENFNGIFNSFFENIEQINMDYLELLNGFIQSDKFLMSIIKQFKKIILQQNHDFSSLRLEIELTEKNQNFLKNSIIYLQQYTIENFLNIIPKGEFDEILNDLNNLSTNISHMDAPDIIKISSNISDETNQKITNFLNEKNLIVENLNEKLNYLNKEIEILKKTEAKLESQDKKEKVVSAQLHKLQAQLKLKEEEIARLNERIEEHLKTINKLSKDQNNNLNKTISNFQLLSPEQKGFNNIIEKKDLEGEKGKDHINNVSSSDKIDKIKLSIPNSNLGANIASPNTNLDNSLNVILI